MAPLVPIGEVAGTHGVKGRLRVAFLQGSHTVLFTQGTWCFLEFQNKPVPFFIEWADVVEDGALLKLRGIHTPEEVQALRGKRVWATSEALTGYRAQKTSDIIGYLVVNYDDGKEIGPVRQMHSASGNELIEVDMGHKTVLLPYHASLIRAVDPKGPKLVMDIAHGLLDL